MPSVRRHSFRVPLVISAYENLARATSTRTPTLGNQTPRFLHTYWDEVVLATGAQRVILVHWDDFFTGLDQPLRPMPYLLDRLDITMSRLLPLARRDGIDVVLPVTWQPSEPLIGLG
ncbi:hypothetical protein [Streptomyces sp. NBC_01236]|uniref:hypothetical protein n=1 Tax=Streptomyces sp. NBC_01236 TaxID=2903789 RepID=UPI002E1502C5|nr:hypothetical protein OG324_00635 [Streptomyces sp. NBC_01236]